MERRQRFNRIFSPICDIINIENLYEYGNTINYKELLEKKEKNTNEPALLKRGKYASECPSTDICPMPFYMMIIREDGIVFPCCETFGDMPHIMGSAYDTSLSEIWKLSFLAFQRRMLDGVKCISRCANCKSRLALTNSSDVLDGDADRLKALYDALPRLQQ